MNDPVLIGLVVWGLLGLWGIYELTRLLKFDPDKHPYISTLIVLASGPIVWFIAIVVFLMAVLGVVT